MNAVAENTTPQVISKEQKNEPTIDSKTETIEAESGSEAALPKENIAAVEVSLVIESPTAGKDDSEGNDLVHEHALPCEEETTEEHSATVVPDVQNADTASTNDKTPGDEPTGNSLLEQEATPSVEAPTCDESAPPASPDNNDGATAGGDEENKNVLLWTADILSDDEAEANKIAEEDNPTTAEHDHTDATTPKKRRSTTIGVGTLLESVPATTKVVTACKTHGASVCKCVCVCDVGTFYDLKKCVEAAL
eukprot:m.617729 g.617729  ORF g.617729 m.617729 type:complete len:250 (+) comp22520_c0_seq17:218-967(+)